MGRKKESSKIKSVTFTYSGTDNDLTLFLKAIAYDYLVKNNMIVNKQLKDEDNSAETK